MICFLKRVTDETMLEYLEPNASVNTSARVKHLQNDTSTPEFKGVQHIICAARMNTAATLALSVSTVYQREGASVARSMEGQDPRIGV